MTVAASSSLPALPYPESYPMHLLLLLQVFVSMLHDSTHIVDYPHVTEWMWSSGPNKGQGLRTGATDAPDFDASIRRLKLCARNKLLL